MSTFAQRIKYLGADLAVITVAGAKRAIAATRLFFENKEARSFASADEIMRKIRRFDVPDNAPADLADKRPLYLFADDGMRASHYVLPHEATTGRRSTVASAVGLYILIAVVSVLPAMHPKLIYVAGALLLSGWGGYFMSRREDLLLRYGGHLTGASEAGLAVKGLTSKRSNQCAVAAADTSVFFPLATSTAKMSRCIDPLGADAGQTLGLSARDMCTNMFVFGSVGTGKTSGLLRPIINTWLAAKCGGLVLMDGKGDLPQEFDGTPGYRVISPTSGGRIALLAGLEPHDIGPAIGTYDGEAFFVEGSHTLLYQAAVVVKAGAEAGLCKWTLVDLNEFIGDFNKRKDVIGNLPPHVIDANYLLKRACHYWAVTYKQMDDKARSNFTEGVSAWIAPILRHPDLIGWATCSPEDAEVDLSGPLRGAALGVYAPEYLYGAAGSKLAGLVRSQLYAGIKRRGSRDRWNPAENNTDVLLVIDEAALMLSEAEKSMLPIGRSLGLSVVAACQNYDQLESRFGEKEAAALIDCFRSAVAFSSSARTLALMIERSQLTIGPALTQGPFFDTVSSVRRIAQSHPDATRDAISIADNLLPLDTHLMGNSTLAIKPALDEHVLLENGEAVFLLNRGNDLRRDTGMTKRIFAQKKVEVANA